MRFDAYDYQLLAQADGEGMYYREQGVRMSWESAAEEATREARPCSYPLSLNRPVGRIDDIGG